MITYREALPVDAEPIAQLHARSWRHAYRGILSDDYLDSNALDDRRALWQERFNRPAYSQYILTAIEDDQIKGFVCVYRDYDEQWGALVDNLHVSRELKGQGIGSELLRGAARWVRQTSSHPGLHLWVFEQNLAARRFYGYLGGESVERAVKANPGGGDAVSLRYVWRTVDSLL
ncbi:GNAT family N-acetyltransferase [Nibrella saemangeumensis]|uniref:GNAT family N-acetyltransferase n=1 Tax=Nibrella saemangeumensis TaxID=1084526 RepID=A0ABP8NSA4_9BACT